VSAAPALIYLAEGKAGESPWVAINRTFQVEKFSPLDWTDMGEYASDIMDFSGMFVAFTAKNTIRDLPMQHVRLACESEDGGWPDRRLMIACLDPPGPWIPESVRQYVMDYGEIDLTNGGNTRPWCANRLDDLIVRIVWLTP
jgi:hypothetical protein